MANSVRPRDNPPILITPTESIDGVPVDPEANAQVVVIATDTTGDGDLASVSAQIPLSIADASPTLEGLGGFGPVTVPGAGGLVIDVNTARLKVDIMNPNAVRVWLGVGETATAGRGNFVDPGGCFTEYTSGAIYAVAQDGSTISMCGQQWGA